MISLHWIDIAIIVGYIAAIIVMGWLLSKKASKNLNAYFLGGKSLPWWVIGTSHGASGFDIAGTIGKRYRRMDEVGTPFCVTFDFDSLEDQAVTVRDRDTLLQDRIAIDQVRDYLIEKIEE